MKSNHTDGLEARIQALGGALLTKVQTRRHEQSMVEQWIETLLRRLNAEPAFRIQALRFIDVLPSLDDDADLVAIFDEYFAADDFPLPRWGGAALGAGKWLGKHATASVIRRAAQALSGRFLAGRVAAEVFSKVDELRAQGREYSLDRVGEVILSEHEAAGYLQGYLDLIETARKAGRRHLHLSVKLSALYPRIAAHTLDHVRPIVLERLLRLSHAARHAGAGITLDMEDYDSRPLTLAVFEDWLFTPEMQDWPDAGIALQAYLRDTPADVERLIELARRRQTPFMVRLVRGAYWDRECVIAAQRGWPVPVWRRQADTDRCYEACAERLLYAHAAVRTAIATHNPRSLSHAMAVAASLGLETSAFEFQMLYGMAEPMQAALVDMGYRLRVYLPFGEPIPGMAYLVRRLLENASSQSVARLDAMDGATTDALIRTSVDADEPPPFVAGAFVNTPVHRFTDAAERRAFSDAIATVRAALGQEHPLWIDGRVVETPDRIRSICPADPELVVGDVAMAGREQVEAAIEAAQRAFPAWRDMGAAQRAAVLRAAADRLSARRDQFAALQIFEAGKNWIEADADVCEAIDFLRYYADQAERLAETVGVSVPGEHNRNGYRPRGVGVVIPPWNFPLAILTGMLSATLVSGNCAILKPSSDTPVIAAELVGLLVEVGVPAGVIGFLPGSGADVGEYLVEHPATHVIAFTGSREVGCRLIERAAKTAPGQRHVKRVIAEMGGKNAVIVDASADIDEAVAGIVQSAFGFQGQKCSACSRVIVVGPHYRAIVERLCDATADLLVAMPWEPHCDLGPVINAAAAQRIEAVIAEAQQQRRGTLAFRGRLPEGLPGCYVAPAIFADADPDSPLAQEEIFGPVLAVMPADDFDRALAIANATDYALTGGVYSRSPANLRKAEAEFGVGNLYLNRGITGALVARQPFGGFRMSGIGSKAGGPDYLLQFMEPRCVTENTLRRGVAPDLAGPAA